VKKQQGHDLRQFDRAGSFSMEMPLPSLLA
jgi:hypothetical protein